MNKLTFILTVLVVLGILLGLFISYKMIKAERRVKYLEQVVADRDNSIKNMRGHLDQALEHSMVFIHHSVGYGFLTSGGLADSLLNLGIVVRGATYGDEVGQETDICHWVPKFSNELDQILKFREHPNQYFDGDRTNDIVMFKSCFPNSGIQADNSSQGDPTSPNRTLANYKATFEQLKKSFEKYPDKLFVYMTSPPLNPGATTPDEAKRAREFANWLTTVVKANGPRNFVVYDLFAFLADADGFLKAEYRPNSSTDSHPNTAANRAVAGDFTRFFAPIWQEWQQTTQVNPL